MTVTCGIHRDGMVFLGADRRFISGNKIEDYHSKIVVSGCGRIALAFSGYARNIFLMRELGDKLFHEATASTIASKLKQALKDDGCTFSKTECENLSFEGSILMASSAGLFEIDQNFTPYLVPEGVFISRGTGEAYAVGAAHARSEDDITGTEILEGAIGAAIANCTSCGGDSEIVSVLIKEATKWHILADTAA